MFLAHERQNGLKEKISLNNDAWVFFPRPDAPSFDLCGHDEKVLSVDWSHHKHVASGSADCTAQIYDIAV